MNVGHDFSGVTEAPGHPATRAQLARMYQRYRFAASRCEGRRVLEVACGAGMGLGYLAARSRMAVGGDYTQGLVQKARGHYGTRLPLLCLDAQALPFRDGTFDTVILFEAIYYIPSPREFLAECRRVLAPGGEVLVCSVNPQWQGFSPSEGSVRYFSATELRALLEEASFATEVFGGFPSASGGSFSRAVEGLRALAVRLHLIPRTLKGREALKRLFYGRMRPIPAEVQEGMAELHPVEPLALDAGIPTHKILYLRGKLR
jgi:ubiquinone/menaquinone biosynthesis C-methylase UbiE